MPPLSPREIETWIPQSLSQIVGCRDVKLHFENMLRLGRRGQNTMVTGPSRTCKSATVKAYIRAEMCPHRDPQSLKPCGKCSTCIDLDIRKREEGLYAILRSRVMRDNLEPLFWYPINCGMITEAGLREVLEDIPDQEGRTIIHLDETHRLVRRHMDHLLLVPLDQYDVQWIATTAHPNELDPMFRNRFTAKLATTLPTEAELVAFLADRCGDWEINFECQDTLRIVARRSGLRPGIALGILANAAGHPDRKLTRDLAINHILDF